MSGSGVSNFSLYSLCLQEVQGSDWAAGTSADRVSVMSRVRHQVRGEQQRWKGAVQEQRRHIYDHHTMLN